MAIQVSPGVSVSEIDLTTSVPAISTSIGGIAAPFVWGPCNTAVTVTSEVQLNNIFGNPNNDTANGFFTAANFLSYSNNLQVIRVNLANSTTATATGNNVAILNDADYYDKYFYSGDYTTAGAWAARYIGDLGNSLSVYVWANAAIWTANSSNTSDPLYTFAKQFDYAPNTSPYVINVLTGQDNYVPNSSYVNDEIHVLVVDTQGLFTGYANTILEKYQSLSVLSDAKAPDGSSNYYRDVIYKQSNYIHWMGPPTANAVNWGNTVMQLINSGTTVGQDATLNVSALMGGSVGNVSTISQATGNAMSLFMDKEKIDISLLMTGNPDLNVAQQALDIVENRTDCIAFLSPPLSSTQDHTNPAGAIVSYFNEVGPSSYAVGDSGWKYMYDKYNDIYRWVPLNGDIAGLCAYTDNVRAPWWSPAGLQRGVIKNSIKLALNPNQAQRDTLYKGGVNPVVSFPGEGTILYGDKTLLNRPSAFDRINVRRLFIVLEKTISKAARASLFEFNDDFTRSQFIALVDPFLRTVQSQRGMYAYKVVCDTTNNTPDIIDANQFVGDIYIQPARSINFIQLNFVATRTGVDFSSVVGQF
jgi:Phage tail sheath protein subtilisin-like domain/Phage tail sheath C-terminal domain